MLAALEKDHGLKSADKLGNKLAKKGLPNEALLAAKDLGANQTPRLRIDTVHQAKGESLDAILYIATKEHISALLAGVDSEIGRIGYVAVTRAKNIFWLAVPANALKELQPDLIAYGFKKVGDT